MCPFASLLQRTLLCGVFFGLFNKVWAEVPLFIFAGQSNMVGFRTDVSELGNDERAAQPNVFFFGPNDDGEEWSVVDLAKSPTQISQTASGRGFGPEAVVGRTLLESGRFQRIAEVKFVFNGGVNRSFLAAPTDAVAGSYEPGISSTWMPEADLSGAQSLYKELLNRIRRAQVTFAEKYGEKTYIAGFFWMQGESDAQNAHTASLYGRHLHRLITALRRDLGAPDMPFVYGRIRDADIFPEDRLVRAGQDEVADPSHELYQPFVSRVDTDALQMYSTVDPSAGDGPGHYSSQGTWELGRLMAQAYLSLAQPPPGTTASSEKVNRAPDE